MVSGMETTPAQDLDDVKRLRSATITESGRVPRGAFAVLVAGILVFASGFEFIENGWIGLGWIAAWWVFVISWIVWLKRHNRAELALPPLPQSERRRRRIEWVAMLVAGQAIVQLGSRVSWILAGVLLAIMAVGQGGLNWLRWRRVGTR